MLVLPPQTEASARGKAGDVRQQAAVQVRSELPVQNRQRFSWTEERVVETLERIITEAFDTLVETYDADSLPNLRTAAYIVGLSRVIGAYEAAGNWP